MWPLLLARWRHGRRALAANAFELGVLLPIIGLAVLLIAGRALEVFRAPIAGLLADPILAPKVMAATAVLLMAAFWPGTWRALYGRKEQIELLDILPVRERDRLIVLLLGLPLGALPIAVAWAAGGYVLANIGEVAEYSFLLATLRVWPAALLLKAWALALAQTAARLGGGRAASLAIGLAILLLAALSPAGPWLALPFHAAGAVLLATWSVACGLPVPSTAGTLAAQPTTLIGSLFFALILAALLFRGRRRDLERAGAQTERALPLPAAGRPKAAARAGRALVRRDLLLTSRFFAPAVPLAFAAWALISLALGLALAAAKVVTPGDLQRFQALAVACAAAAGWPLVALVPFLLARQAREPWLESLLGVPGPALVSAKCRTALALAALPAVTGALIAGGAAWLRVGDGMLAAMIVAQILSALAMLALTFGLGAWETPGEPWLAVVYSSILGGLCVSLVTLAPSVLWVWWLAYAWLFTQLRSRSLARAQFMERPR
jgi:hypothetical protein